VKILLDECVPAQVRHAFAGHDVTTVQEQGWTGIKNGVLLAAAESAGFDLFIVADKNLRHQQNLAGRRLAILELWTNHRPTLEKHFAAIRAAAESLQTGEYCPLAHP
jgi:predicted nuclease of predicted toxin-antitoxin system